MCEAIECFRLTTGTSICLLIRLPKLLKLSPMDGRSAWQRGFLDEVFHDTQGGNSCRGDFGTHRVQNRSEWRRIRCRGSLAGVHRSGRVAPAINFANAADAAPANHDAILAAVSQAQAAAGDRLAAIESASQIGDDRMLTDTLGSVRAQPMKAAGAFGGNQADFDSLIQLITSTIAAPTWDDVGGQGSIMPFPNGVYVDPQGVLQKQTKDDRTGALELLRNAAAERQSNSDVRKSSALRKVSLVQFGAAARTAWSRG